MKERIDENTSQNRITIQNGNERINWIVVTPDTTIIKGQNRL